MSVRPALLRLFHSSKTFLSYERYARNARYALACSSPFSTVHSQFPQNSPACFHSHSSATRVSCSLRAPQQQRYLSAVAPSAADEREPVEPIAVDHRAVADGDIRYFRSLLGDRCVTDPVELETHNLDWQRHYKGIAFLATHILHSVFFLDLN